MIAALSFIVCIIGLIAFYVSKDANNREIAKIMFWTGLLAFLLQSGYVFTYFGIHRP